MPTRDLNKFLKVMIKTFKWTSTTVRTEEYEKGFKG